MSSPSTTSGFERGGVDQLGEQEGRTEVGEQAQFLAQAQQAGAGPHLIRNGLVAGHAGRAEQDGVGLARDPRRSPSGRGSPAASTPAPPMAAIDQFQRPRSSPARPSTP